jgi:hypothetical protein
MKQFLDQFAAAAILAASIVVPFYLYVEGSL